MDRRRCCGQPACPLAPDAGRPDRTYAAGWSAEAFGSGRRELQRPCAPTRPGARLDITPVIVHWPIWVLWLPQSRMHYLSAHEASKSAIAARSRSCEPRTEGTRRAAITGPFSPRARLPRKEETLARYDRHKPGGVKRRAIRAAVLAARLLGRRTTRARMPGRTWEKSRSHRARRGQQRR